MTDTYDIPGPNDPILVTAEKIEYSYERTDGGDDLVLLVIRDPLAPVVVALSTEQAAEVVGTIGTMLQPSKLDELRREWLDRNTDND